MHRFHSWKLAMGVVGAGIAFAGACEKVSADVIYSTGFENPPFAPGSQLLGQDGWSTAIPPFLSPNAAIVSTVAPASGAQNVRVRGADLVSDSADLAPYDAVGSYRLPVNYTVTSAQPVVRLETDMRLETSHAPTSTDFWSQTLAARSGDGETLGEFGLSSQGIVEAYGFDAQPGASALFTRPANFNQWYHLTLDLDFAHHTASYYVDGSLLGTITDASTSNVLLRGAMVVYANPDGGGDARADYTAGFDNFSITSVPEPISASLLILGVGCFARRRRRTA